MSRPPEPSSLTLRHDLRPGDLGWITYLHGVIYAREYGHDVTFEPYVARPLADFVERGPAGGRLWLAEAGERIVGSIAIVTTEVQAQGQLRWFLLEPEHRGNGNGRRMLSTALAWARAAGFASLHLWTFDDLHGAIRLYREHGFIETAREHQIKWGGPRTELRMDLRLDGPETGVGLKSAHD